MRRPRWSRAGGGRRAVDGAHVDELGDHRAVAEAAREGAARPLDVGGSERPRMAVRRLCGGGRLYGVGLIDLTLEVTLPASLALLVLSSLSWRMPAGAEERAALSTRACTHLRSSVERQAYSHVKAGTCVSSRVRRSRIITWLKGRHALHYLLVIDQHADRCALAACARRHVGDTTISNRVRPAAHHDATVHLVPRYWLQVMMEASVAETEPLCAFSRPSLTLFLPRSS